VEFATYAILGLVGGFVSVAFVKLLLWQRKKFLAMPIWTRWFQPVAGGITVGLLGWFAPDVLGVGYGAVGQALNGHMVLGTMALLVCLKLVATATCYSSGNAGGIFGPALFIGAMLGGAVGAVAHIVMPYYTGNVGAYALVGMGAAFAGIIRVPLTSVIMIFEVTRDYTIIVPLMIANLLSYYVSSRLQEEPIYEGLLHQDGIHLPLGAGARAKERILHVSDALRPGGEPLAAVLTVAEARARADRRHKAWPVANDTGLCGMVSAQRLDQAIANGQGGESLAALVPEPGPAEGLTQDVFPHLHADHPLDVALRKLAETGWDVLPVVSRDNVRQWKGTISLQDILAAYGVVHSQGESASASQPQSKPDQTERQQS
jgi:CIC family chloride channel protein